jgi:hypothetical protein
VKPHELYDFRKTGAILHELAMADWWRAFMAKIRFWAEELRQASISRQASCLGQYLIFRHGELVFRHSEIV